MTCWNPHPESLQEVLGTIREAVNTKTDTQRRCTQKLDTFTRLPDYIALLAHIVGDIRSEHEHIRTLAAYLLKNNANLILSSSPEAAQYVKEATLRAFYDSSIMVRNAATRILVAMLSIIGPQNWSECLHHIIRSLNGRDPIQREAALNLLKNACEDYPRKLDITIEGTRLFNYLVPKFLMLADHPSPRTRSYALACLSSLISAHPETLSPHINQFLEILSRAALDDNPSVRQRVCQALVMFLGTCPQRIISESYWIAEFILRSTQDKDVNLALEACEFWLTFAEHAEFAPFLQPLVKDIAPILLDCMRYEDDNKLWIMDNADDTAVTDKEHQPKPRPLKPATHSCGQTHIHSSQEEDYFHNGNLTEQFSMEWNIRKCAAATLDLLAVRFKDQLLNAIVKPLATKLWSSNWLDRESSILTLGAIAEGCMQAMEPHLPTVLPYLINSLNDTKALIRSMASWTLGRYASWTIQATVHEHNTKYFIPTMKGLLRMLLDNNKRVQEASCSAFATLEECASIELSPYIELILPTLTSALDKYEHKNMTLLYDTIGTLADAVGNQLSTQSYIEFLVPPLLHHTLQLNNDVRLIPLIKCLTSLAIAIGPSLLPYARPLYIRCCTIIHNSLMHQNFLQQNSTLDEPENSLLIAALDLLSALTRGLGMAVQTVIDDSQAHPLTLILLSLQHPQPAVRQSAYGLVGDMAISCFTLLHPYITQIMTCLTLQLYPNTTVDHSGASDNAAWAAGEIALRYDQNRSEFQQWVNPLISTLIPILLRPDNPTNLRENAAISIGRISMMYPSLVAPHLPDFVQEWCQTLYLVCDNQEKESAFRGICILAQNNPASITKNLGCFCHAIVSWNDPSPVLKEMFASLLRHFKEHDERRWASEVTTFPPIVQELLATRYSV